MAFHFAFSWSCSHPRILKILTDSLCPRYAVIDRKIAIVQSNNIQDIDNVEMMTQFEGDIVDSFYDIALISWHNLMKPTLPCLTSPNSGGQIPTFDSDSYATLFDGAGKLVTVYEAYVSRFPSAAL